MSSSSPSALALADTASTELINISNISNLSTNSPNLTTNVSNISVNISITKSIKVPTSERSNEKSSSGPPVISSVKASTKISTSASPSGKVQAHGKTRQASTNDLSDAAIHALEHAPTPIPAATTTKSKATNSVPGTPLGTAASNKSAALNAATVQQHQDEKVMQDFKDVICEHSELSLIDRRNRFVRVVSQAENGNSIQYAVSFMALPSLVANTFMYRRNEDAYKAALEKPFVLDLFPPRLQPGIQYKPEYSQLSRYVTAYRIRRLVLMQEIDSFEELTKDLLNLQAICQEKKTAIGDRILTLEHEINNLIPADPSSPASRFNALLLNHHGWKTINFFFHRELKRVQAKVAEANQSGDVSNPPTGRTGTGALGAGLKHDAASSLVELGEEVDESMTTEILQHCWKLLQFWRLVRCVEAMCRLGPDNYPYKKTDDDNLKGLNVNHQIETIVSKSMDLIGRSRSSDPGSDLDAENDNSRMLQLSRESLENHIHGTDSHAIPAVGMDLRVLSTDGMGTAPSAHIDANSPLLKLMLPSSALSASKDNGEGTNSHRQLHQPEQGSHTFRNFLGMSTDRRSTDNKDNENSVSVSVHGGSVHQGGSNTFRSRLTNLDVFSPLTTALKNVTSVDSADNRLLKQQSTNSSIAFTNRQSSHLSSHHSSHHSHRHVPTALAREIKLIHQFRSDQVIAGWQDVCTLLKTSRPLSSNKINAADASIINSTFAAAAAVQDIVLGEADFSSLMDKATLTNLQFALSAGASSQPGEPSESEVAINNDFLASCMNQVCDSIADQVEKQLLHAFRMMPNWLIMLEELRRDRIKTHNGKLLIKEKLEIEIDVTGKRKTYPIPDVHVDTDILHNIMQRLHFQVVAPEVEVKLGNLKRQRVALKGELACLIQFAYVLTVPFLQRNLRRIQVQRKYAHRLRLLVYCSMHASVVVVQSVVRMRQKRKWYLILREQTELAIKNAAATQIQRIIRGYHAYVRYLAHLRARQSLSDWYAITKYQALIRGFIARHRHRKQMAANEEARKLAVREWGITKIQKIIRGYLARQVLVPSVRLRKTLSPEMLRLVERYLQQGNLWQFLRQLDAEYGRLRTELQSHEQREDLLATTFLNKVLTRRSNEFDQSWTMFSDAIEAHKAGMSVDSNRLQSSAVHSMLSASNSIGMQLELQDGKLSAMGKPSTAVTQANMAGEKRLYAQEWTGSQSLESVAEPAPTILPQHMDISPSRKLYQHEILFEVNDRGETPGSPQPQIQSSTPPSPVRSMSSGAVMIPSSPSMHSRTQSRTQSRTATRRSRAVDTSVGANTSHAAGSTRIAKPVPGALLRRALTSTVQSGVDREMDKLKNSSSRTTQLTNEMKQVYDPVEPTTQALAHPQLQTLGRSRGNKQTPTRGQMSASTTDWLTNAADEAISSQSLTRQLPTLQPAERLTGTNTPKRRCLSPKRADISSSAASRDFSDEHFGAGARSAANARISKGIQQLGESLLLDVPRGLEDTLEKLLRAAAIRCFVPTFFRTETQSNSQMKADEAFKIYQSLPLGLAKMRYEQEAWNWASGTIHKLFTKGLIYIKDTLPASKCHMFLKSCECPPLLLEKCLECLESLHSIGVSVSMGYTHKQTIEQAEKITGNSLSVHDEMQLYREEARSQKYTQADRARSQALEHPDTDPTIGAKLLVNMVEEGPWMSLAAPIDELIMHAAYLCVPFVPYAETRSDSDLSPTRRPTDMEDRMGQQEFTKHVQELQSLDHQQKRDCVRQRYRAALLIATPFVLSLKDQEQVRTVRDLLTVSMASQTQIPLALRTQIEVLLSVVIAVSANAKIIPTHRNYLLSNNSSSFTIPTMFDPRFQRSPYDPYGRPARLNLGHKYPHGKKQTGGSNGIHRSTENMIDGEGVAVNGMNLKHASDYQEIPGGLWEIREDEQEEENEDHLDISLNRSLTASLSDQMWHFNASTISSATGGLVGSDQAAGSKAVTVVTGVKLSDSVGTGAPAASVDNLHQRETTWNKRDFAAVQAQRQQAETEKQVQPLNPRHLQPLVHLGMRGPENKLLPDLVPTSAMDKANREAKKQRQSKQSHLHGPHPKTRSMQPKLTMKLTQSELESTHRMHAYNKDIMLRMQDDFVRPYRCSYPHCGQCFSRLYTLRVHEKSHVTFPEYHKYKRELKIFLDDDVHAVAQERQAELQERTSISQPILRELGALQEQQPFWEVVDEDLTEQRKFLMSRSLSTTSELGHPHVRKIGTSSGSRGHDKYTGGEERRSSQSARHHTATGRRKGGSFTHNSGEDEVVKLMSSSMSSLCLPGVLPHISGSVDAGAAHATIQTMEEGSCQKQVSFSSVPMFTGSEKLFSNVNGRVTVQARSNKGGDGTQPYTETTSLDELDASSEQFFMFS
jgi:hypothetical protein